MNICWTMMRIVWGLAQIFHPQSDYTSWTLLLDVCLEGGTYGANQKLLDGVVNSPMQVNEEENKELISIVTLCKDRVVQIPFCLFMRLSRHRLSVVHLARRGY